jgi:hypothetical protein
VLGGNRCCGEEVSAWGRWHWLLGKPGSEDPSRAETCQSGTDDEVGRHKSPYDPSKTAPEKEHLLAGFRPRGVENTPFKDEVLCLRDFLCLEVTGAAKSGVTNLHMTRPKQHQRRNTSRWRKNTDWKGILSNARCSFSGAVLDGSYGDL